MTRENRLATAQSPYLLQHAHNPVRWHPWDDEALALAKAEDKPIFLSVGYSTCHWCHVMERESFEDEQTAALLAKYFVSIKVDREERPDIDRVYMSYVQAVSGSGGWPMSVWLTPDLQPFFGGTYFPPEDRYGRPGFRTLIEELGKAWEQQRERVEQTAQGALAVLRQLEASNESADLPPHSARDAAYATFRRAFDRAHGGFGGAPKFPRPVTLQLLLLHHERTGDAEAAMMVRKTLDEMARGGIYDHLGGGFHRYSVDREWHVPHFEKMLYDQAQLLSSYISLYQLEGAAAHAEVAQGIAGYVLRDLCDSEEGGFYSAEDADSLPTPDAPQKKEGAFYVWTADELERELGDDYESFAHHFGVEANGNAEDPHGELSGTNVLHARGSLSATARHWNISEGDASRRLERAKKHLFANRETRPRPHLDDKILCSWNGMMISALARAASPLSRDAYLVAAQRAASFVERRLQRDDTLYRSYRAEQAGVRAFVEDYAQLIEGLIDLYQASFELRWLRWAETLQSRQLELFWDENSGGFFANDGEDASVLLRLKDDYDGAEPAASSTSALNLLRLAALLGRPEWEERARRTIGAFSTRLEKAPEVLPRLVTAYDLLLRGPVSLVIVGVAKSPATATLAATARNAFAPRLALLFADSELRSWLGARQPHVASLPEPEGDDDARAYLCRDQRCEAPISDPKELERALRAAGSPS